MIDQDARGEEGDGEEVSSERACTSQEDSEDSEAERRREKKRKQQQEADTLAALRVCPATAFHLRRLDLEDKAKLENQKQKDDDNEFNVAGMPENEKKQFEMTFRDQQIEATEMGVLLFKLFLIFIAISSSSRWMMLMLMI